MATIDPFARQPVCRHAFVLASRALRLGLAVACLVTLAVGPSGGAGADGTVVSDEAGEDAPHISLLGDSTLAGVRWWGNYGDLSRYNFVFDAESCRRTLEESCFSREGFRPDNTVAAMQRLAGRLGELVVVMSGYNDSGYLFDDAIDAVVTEARRQDIDHVVWLTLRDQHVSYRDPQERANVDGYRDDNLLLYAKAAELGGYLQVADWATDAWDRPEWFEYDGVHLTEEGVRGLTTFIAEGVDVVLDGGSLNPDLVPWSELGDGSDGPAVAVVQRALLDNGVTEVGVIDGLYGEQTSAAVEAFQEQRDLPVTGTVDDTTAVALGVLDEADVVRPVAARSTAPPSPSRSQPSLVTRVPATIAAEPAARTLAAIAAVAAVAAVGALAVALRSRRGRPDRSGGDGQPPVGVPAVAPYNYELEESLTG
jgi:peptidoglycan hydrolase-like protein with peptidoglycan-binding domain